MHHEPRANGTSRIRCAAIWLLAALSFLHVTGCRTTRYIQKRNTRENPLAASLALVSDRGPHQSVRTARLIERYGLQDKLKESPQGTIMALEGKEETNEEAERLYAVAELAYIEGKKAKRRGESVAALNHFGQAIKSSYRYLFSPEYEGDRNPYDPQFRGACDLYNQALEDTLRLLRADGRILPGRTYEIKSGDQKFVLRTRLDARWDPDDFAQFDHFKFVSDYEIKTLNNRHTTYGLGVPLIAVRKTTQPEAPFEKYYPDVLSFPCTALLECKHTGATNENGAPEVNCELVFYNPMRSTRTEFAQRTIPLETDITTPLAFSLDNKQFQSKNIATVGLFNPNKVADHRGLYMLEAYDPKRIPVVMVHGLWSSPMTWMDMFNDLRSFPEVRERYQFWFYLYPTGQPFWISAVQMRKDMQELSDMVAAHHPAEGKQTWDQLVLVGHSMGGLVSRLQTFESGEDYWRILSNKSIEDLQASDEDRERLASTLFFKPNSSVKRVITIGTPHRGSDYSNDATQWLGRRFIKLPSFLTAIGSRLIRQNPGFFRDTELLTTNTSIDSLSPKSPIFPVMMRSKRSPSVKYHNIIGLVSTKSLLGRIKTNSDGIVERESAEVSDADSQITVQAEHTTVHTKPKSILEVRRILLKHLKEIESQYRVASNPIPSSAIEPVSVTFTDEPASPLPAATVLPASAEMPPLPQTLTPDSNPRQAITPNPPNPPEFDAGMLR